MSILDVSRETIVKLDHYVGLLERWNPTVNLIGKSTVGAIWPRHVIDSYQLLRLTSLGKGVWLDLGSGGGFPGMVCAILAAELQPNLKFSLVESDGRKAAFLRTVSRETSVSVAVVNERIEELRGVDANIVTARALAPLPKLLSYVYRHMSSTGTALLPKGQNAENELVQARKTWKFELETVTSLTDQKAVILKVGALERA